MENVASKRLRKSRGIPFEEAERKRLDNIKATEKTNAADTMNNAIGRMNEKSFLRSTDKSIVKNLTTPHATIKIDT